MSDTSTDEQKLKALVIAAKHYRLHMKTLRTSDPKGFTDIERTIAIEEVPRQKKLECGSAISSAGSQY